MLSFEQFLIEGLLATRVKDKKFLHPARQALKNVGFLSDNAEFNIINTHKTEGFKLNDILTKRGVYGINSTIKNIHLVGIPKTPIVGDDKLKLLCTNWYLNPMVLNPNLSQFWLKMLKMN